MAVEIERKFRVEWNEFPNKTDFNTKAKVIEAGYFLETPAIRVTVTNHLRFDPKYKICIKGPGGLSREEYEYHVPAEDALGLLKLAPTYLLKYRLDVGGWEVDYYPAVFEYGLTLQSLQPLLVAEWEESHHGPIQSLPEWIGKEVTDNRDWSNASLAMRHGYKNIHDVVYFDYDSQVPLLER